MIRWVIFVILLCAVSACGPRVTDESGLRAFLQAPQNGLSQSKQINGLTVTVQYLPSILLAYADEREANGQEDTTQAISAEVYAQSQYFLLTLTHSKGEILSPATLGFAKYSALLQTLSFHLADYAHLVQGLDTLCASNTALDRTFGMGAGTQLLLAFPANKEKVHDEQLFLQDFGLGSGTMCFTFSQEDLRAIPALRPHGPVL